MTYPTGISESHGASDIGRVDADGVDDARVDVFDEGFAQAFLEAQLLDHPVERGGEQPDLVP